MTFGFIAVSHVNHIPLKISVIKKISDVLSRIVVQDVATAVLSVFVWVVVMPIALVAV